MTVRSATLSWPSPLSPSLIAIRSPKTWSESPRTASIYNVIGYPFARDYAATFLPTKRAACGVSCHGRRGVVEHVVLRRWLLGRCWFGDGVGLRAWLVCARGRWGLGWAAFFDFGS